MAVPTTTENLQPLQVRAARAIAGISMETLGELAGVSSETIMRVETGITTASRSTTARLVHAFGLLGIELLAEQDGHGAGARMREPGGAGAIDRRDALRGGQEIGVVLRIGGKPATARVAAEALAPGGDTAAALAAFDGRRAEIAAAVSRKLEAGAVDPDGHLRITAADLAYAGQGAAA